MVLTQVLKAQTKEVVKMSNITKKPQYDTMLFTEVWEEVNDFIYDFNNIGIPKKIKVESAQTLYYLLYARYGNNPIANLDIEQFKYKVFSTIFMYGPTWEKRLDIQDKLRGLTEDQLLAGSKAIYNTALNPSAAPTTTTTEELDYINSQNTTNYKKSKMDAYTQLWDLLATDVTNDFLIKFRPCFKTFVMPERPLLYVTDEESEEDEGE